ncbi:hypothetical protein GIB67_018647 [Kingdonia uniflora]|uniref:Uncharacterized protein n=1 Tax=Kingdonia uniflora TaxID=39325 RepID=A0A7J7M2H7_9MAGN|nr:hypothetical protein GIB67_018647 [Kingdonia uniflora]
MINMYKTNPGTPFHIWIVNELRVHSQNSQNFILISVLRVKGCPPPKILVQVKACPLPKRGDLCAITHFLILNLNTGIPQSNVHILNEPVLTNVHQSNEPFQTIPTDVPLSNEPCISQSNIYLSNEHELTNVPLSNKPEPIIG